MVHKGSWLRLQELRNERSVFRGRNDTPTNAPNLVGTSHVAVQERAVISHKNICTVGTLRDLGHTTFDVNVPGQSCVCLLPHAQVPLLIVAQPVGHPKERSGAGPQVPRVESMGRV